MNSRDSWFITRLDWPMIPNYCCWCLESSHLHMCLGIYQFICLLYLPICPFSQVYKINKCNHCTNKSNYPQSPVPNPSTTRQRPIGEDPPQGVFGSFSALKNPSPAMKSKMECLVQDHSSRPSSSRTSSLSWGGYPANPTREWSLCIILRNQQVGRIKPTTPSWCVPSKNAYTTHAWSLEKVGEILPRDQNHGFPSTSVENPHSYR